jgi:hypothetical protein
MVFFTFLNVEAQGIQENCALGPASLMDARAYLADDLFLTSMAPVTG